MFGKNIDIFEKLPTATNHSANGIIRILKAFSLSIYFYKFELMPVFTLKSMELVLKYGNSTESIISYGGYALITSNIFKDYKKAYEWGEFMSRQVKKFNAAQQQPFVDLIRFSFLHHPNKNIKEMLLPNHQAYRKCLETGNTGLAFYIAFSSAYMNFFSSEKLSFVLKLLNTYKQKLQLLKDQITFQHLEMYAQMYKMLHFKSNSIELIEGNFDYEVLIQSSGDANKGALLFGYHSNQLIYAYLRDDYATAYTHIIENEKYLHTALGSYLLRMYYYFSALTYIQVLDGQINDLEYNGTAIKKKLDKYIGLFKKWGKDVPENYLHKYVLLNAEMKRLESKYKHASHLYDEAIVLAEKENLMNEVGLIRKIAARFYLSQEDSENAKWNYEKAIEAFNHWEAFGLVEHIQKEQQTLLDS